MADPVTEGVESIVRALAADDPAALRDAVDLVFRQGVVRGLSLVGFTAVTTEAGIEVDLMPKGLRYSGTKLFEVF